MSAGYWTSDIDARNWTRWTYIDGSEKIAVVMIFHNHNRSLEAPPLRAIAEWTWAFPADSEHPIPDTARTLEERQAWAITQWRMR